MKIKKSTANSRHDHAGKTEDDKGCQLPVRLNHLIVYCIDGDGHDEENLGEKVFQYIQMVRLIKAYPNNGDN